MDESIVAVSIISPYYYVMLGTWQHKSNRLCRTGFCNDAHISRNAQLSLMLIQSGSRVELTQVCRGSSDFKETFLISVLGLEKLSSHGMHHHHYMYLGLLNLREML